MLCVFANLKGIYGTFGKKTSSNEDLKTSVDITQMWCCILVVYY